VKDAGVPGVGRRVRRKVGNVSRDEPPSVEWSLARIGDLLETIAARLPLAPATMAALPPDTPSGIQAAVAARLRGFAEQQQDEKLAAAFRDAADAVDRSEL
jgi:hypothetical protein